MTLGRVEPVANMTQPRRLTLMWEAIMAPIILHAVRNNVVGYVGIRGVDWFASDQSFLFSEFLVRNTAVLRAADPWKTHSRSSQEFRRAFPGEADYHTNASWFIET